MASHNSPKSGDDQKTGRSCDRHRREDYCQLSESDIEQITGLLWMDPTDPVDKKWYDKQKDQVQTLNRPLRRPNLLRRVTDACVNEFRKAPEPVDLCGYHKELDPHLIRHVSFLVHQGLITHANQFRKWGPPSSLPELLGNWLHRINAAMASWVDSDCFVGKICYRPPAPKYKDKCRACALADVGGRVQLLGDLRAGLVNGVSRAPWQQARLLDIVDAWIRHHPPKTRITIYTQSRVLADAIGEMARERSGEGNSRSQREPQLNRHKRKPIPQSCEPQQGSIPEVISPMEYDHSNEELVEQHFEHAVEPACEYSTSEDDARSMGNRTWDWIGRSTLEDTDLDFSVYASMSAVPEPLVRHAPPPRGSWASLTVRSEDEDHRNECAEKFKPLSREPELQSAHGFSQAEGLSPEQYEEVDKTGEYIPARLRWDSNPAAPDPSGPRPTSSIYSSHPGFRRSVRDKESTVFSAAPGNGEPRRSRTPPYMFQSKRTW